jgi:hypothetical protein
VTSLDDVNTDDLVTSAEAARILDVDRSTITRWSDPRLSDRRLIPVRKLDGLRGAKLFRRADVEALAEQLAATA